MAQTNRSLFLPESHCFQHLQLKWREGFDTKRDCWVSRNAGPCLKASQRQVTALFLKIVDFFLSPFSLLSWRLAREWRGNGAWDSGHSAASGLLDWNRKGVIHPHRVHHTGTGGHSAPLNLLRWVTKKIFSTQGWYTGHPACLWLRQRQNNISHCLVLRIRRKYLTPLVRYTWPVDKHMAPIHQLHWYSSILIWVYSNMPDLYLYFSNPLCFCNTLLKNIY